MFNCTLAFCQGTVKFKLDTLHISLYEFVEVSTNNGSDCICNIVNTSNVNNSTVVITGAPKSQTLNLDSSKFVNGVHILPPSQQLLIVADFKGGKITILNLSISTSEIIVMYHCPK